jgi:hypothetical protein
VLKWAFPKVEWEMHHVFIQQAWSKGTGQIYDDLLANEGLRRVGNGIWNLMPIPRALNNWLGRSGYVHQLATQLIATAYYSIMVFGGWHAVAAFSE